jgi:hypothetical protein
VHIDIWDGLQEGRMRRLAIETASRPRRIDYPKQFVSQFSSIGEESTAWKSEVSDDCAVVQMNINKVNIQNNLFFADLHSAFDRLEIGFSELPVVLTELGDTFSAGIDFQYSFEIFGSGNHGTLSAIKSAPCRR